MMHVVCVFFVLFARVHPCNTCVRGADDTCVREADDTCVREADECSQSNYTCASAHCGTHCRAAYLDLVQRKDGREQLVSVAQELQREQRMDPYGFQRLEEGAAADGSGRNLKVQTNEVPPRLFSFANDKVVTIGRSDFNDIVVAASSDSFETLSRLHVIILPLPDTGEMLVCDVGSARGIKISERSGLGPSSEESISKPGSRCVKWLRRGGKRGR